MWGWRVDPTFPNNLFFLKDLKLVFCSSFSLFHKLAQLLNSFGKAMKTQSKEAGSVIT
jgi:hypothetical protein